MTIFDYAKLDSKEKLALLSSAQLVEEYTDADATVSVYFLDSIFVEVVSVKGEIVDFTPFARYAVA